MQSALRHEMVSGWAVPVRVGNRVLAVLEFYCHFCLREDREALAAVETAAASLGQMLARSQERGRAEELYRQQEILLDSVADGICGVDRHGHGQLCQPRRRPPAGRRPHPALTGQPVHELLHGAAPPDHQCGEDCPLRRATSRQTAAAGEDTIFRSDGSSFPAEYALTPILDQGRFSGSVLSFRDISQRYALDRLKDEFISTVSHELRTPLTSIRGALGLLSSGILGEVNDKAANLLRIALTNSDRLVRLINDILDLERIQSGREPLAFRPVQLGEHRPPGHRRHAAGGRRSRRATDPRHHPGGDRRRPRPPAPGAHQPALQRRQVLSAQLYRLRHAAPRRHAASPFPSSTRAAAFPPTSWRPSSAASSRWTPPTRARKAAAAWVWPSAAPSSCNTPAASGRSAIPSAAPPSASFFPTTRLHWRRPPACPRTNPGTAQCCWPAPTRMRACSIAAQLTRHGYRVIETATVEQTLAAAHKGVEAILLDTSLDGMNGWEILPLLRRLDPEARTPIVLLSVENSPSKGELGNASPLAPAQ